MVNSSYFTKSSAPTEGFIFCNDDMKSSYKYKYINIYIIFTISNGGNNKESPSNYIIVILIPAGSLGAQGVYYSFPLLITFLNLLAL